jgi:uncharacterized protein YbcI
MDIDPQKQAAAAKRQGLDLVEISNAMVRLYKEQFGRGPTKARSGFSGPDTLVCTLEDSLTPAERNMVKAGEHQRLRELRMYFQHASERDFIESVEQLTGRQVRGFVSGMDVQRDIATEVFYLEPSSTTEGGASEREEQLAP